MRSRPLMLAAAGGLVLIAGGCGTTNLDTREMERQLARHFAPQAGVDVRQVQVTCPSDQELKTGRTFDCTIEIDHRKRTVVITLEKDGAYSAVPTTTPR